MISTPYARAAIMAPTTSGVGNSSLPMASTTTQVINPPSLNLSHRKFLEKENLNIDLEGFA
jgi:hypothetical protein